MSAPSAAIYTKPVLAIYDVGVLGFSNAVVWNCPTRHILDHYDAHVSGRHLDVGVGTGYFLDQCTFPVPDPDLTLADLNRNSLVAAEQRLRRYHPATKLVDVLAPLHLPTAPFESIGANYLLHCLAGPMPNKDRAIEHLAVLLTPGGVLFGTTILGRGVPHTLLARLFLRSYNTLGIFGNLEDDAEGLHALLSAHFHTVNIRVIGSVALFDAHN